MKGESALLKNTFRKVVAVLVLLLFGAAVAQFTRQTAGDPNVAAALVSGLWLLTPIAAVVGLAWWADLRMRGR